MPRKSPITDASGTKRMDSLVSGAAKLGIDLTPEQEGQFHRYYDELVEWNKRINLTSVTEWEAVQTRHFLDSLTVSLVVPTRWLESATLLDVATGAGFPGLPLKIAFPGLKLTLLDATAKKTAFLTHLVDELELSGVDVLTGRSETFAHDEALRGRFDVVVARALAKLSALAELTLPFCRTGGLVIAQKGPEITEELRQAARSIKIIGGKLNKVKQVDAELMGYKSNLVVLEKIAPTPSAYPRRPGMPAKRPL